MHKHVKKTDFFNIFRYREWLYSKIPFLALPMPVYFLTTGFAGLHQILVCVQFSAFTALFLGFGYVINDYCDRSADIRAGKKNYLSSLKSPIALMIVVVVAAIGVLVAFIGHFDFETPILLIIIYFFGMAYSARPFRLKEKGVLGLFASSAAQRSLPLLLLFSYSNIEMKTILFWMAFGFFVGMRYILIHQYIDRDNDKKSGTNTFASKNAKIFRFLIYGTFAIEAVFVVMVSVLSFGWLVTAIIAAAYTVYEALSFYAVEKLFHKSFWLSYVSVPFESLYNFYLPMIVLVKLAIVNLQWLIPLALLCIIMHRAIIAKAEIPKASLRALLKI